MLQVISRPSNGSLLCGRAAIATTHGIGGPGVVIGPTFSLVSAAVLGTSSSGEEVTAIQSQDFDLTLDGSAVITFNRKIKVTPCVGSGCAPVLQVPVGHATVSPALVVENFGDDTPRIFTGPNGPRHADFSSATRDPLFSYQVWWAQRASNGIQAPNLQYQSAMWIGVTRRIPGP